MIVSVGQILVGISNGAGNLAWNLGHNDFAPPEQAETYMAVHVMLTGLRGCLAPFIGSAIYRALGQHGYFLFILSGLVCLTSLLGFASMSRGRARLVPRPPRRVPPCPDRLGNGKFVWRTPRDVS